MLKGLGGLEAGVVEPGGLVNYVSKRPADVHTVTVGTDSHGSNYEALDLGAWFSPSFGVRVNAANEKTHSYIEHADGRRSFVSIAADWKITDKATVLLDTDYQTSGQRSASGYQLLGGTVTPAHPSRTELLGYQSWQRPVGIHSSNTTLRFNYRFDENWNAQVSAGHSHTVIDDNVAFAYGCFYAASCASGATPGYFFAPNGDYDVYDYRSPDDTRQNDELRGVLTGTFATGALDHEVNLGASAFRRTVDQRPYVYDYVGTANIDDPVVPAFDPSPNQPGPFRAAPDQLAAHVVRDRSGPSRRGMAGARGCALRPPERACVRRCWRARTHDADDQDVAAGGGPLAAERATHDLHQLWRRPVARPRGALLDVERRHDPRAVAFTPGRGRREVRGQRCARPAGGHLPHSPVVPVRASRRYGGRLSPSCSRARKCTPAWNSTRPAASPTTCA